MTLKLSIMKEEKRPSIKDYQATAEQLASIAEHDKKRAALVAKVKEAWAERERIKKAERQKRRK